MTNLIVILCQVIMIISLKKEWVRKKIMSTRPKSVKMNSYRRNKQINTKNIIKMKSLRYQTLSTLLNNCWLWTYHQISHRKCWDPSIPSDTSRFKRATERAVQIVEHSLPINHPIDQIDLLTAAQRIAIPYSANLSKITN